MFSGQVEFGLVIFPAIFIESIASSLILCSKHAGLINTRVSPSGVKILRCKFLLVNSSNVLC